MINKELLSLSINKELISVSTEGVTYKLYPQKLFEYKNRNNRYSKYDDVTKTIHLKQAISDMVMNNFWKKYDFYNDKSTISEETKNMLELGIVEEVKC